MFKPAFIALTAAGFLSFCDTAEERAESHFQSGVDLLEEGDVDRALVEFRNVFKLNGQHREARLLYAQTERERGNIREAFGQYLRLVEQYPDSLPGQRALAELSLQVNDWEAARRHAKAAAELAPEDPLVQAVNATIAYRDALSGSEDGEARGKAVATARSLVADNPDLMIARRVIIDDLTRKQDWTAALSAIDAALEQEPEDRSLYAIRLGVLEQLGETTEIRAQFEEMITRFPDDQNVRTSLVRWYMSQGDVDAAESFLKERAAAEPGNSDDIVTYIRFLAEVRDSETALAELERILEGEPPEIERLTALRAGFRFDLGERDEAISELEGLIEGMEPSDERRKIMVMLARILDRTGNNVGARALVEEVLQEDGNQPEALKMRAGWLIESDRTDEAIVALRSVIGDDPDDAEAMTLMAQAHERAGNRDLMADMLSRAVEASGNAAAESLRYAGYLIGEENLRTAETVLINALRLDSGNPALLSALGEVYRAEQDWPRLTQVIETLRRQDDANADRIANELTARRLAAEDREDELMSFLENLAGEGASGLGAAAAIVRTRLAQGDVEGALAYAQETREANPENPNAEFLFGSVQAVTGDTASAQSTFGDLTAEYPQDQRYWLALYNVLAVQEQDDAAKQALRDGLAASPESARLNWALAGVLEREGDVEGAIEIYEKLYAADSNNLIIANNLASLLTTARDDDESLNRAHEIARRLRDRDVPAFQDTYGWIAFRRGDLDTAVSALEPAAEGLPGDPRVQYHLARAYAARDELTKALAQFRKTAELVGDGPRPDFMTEVESEITRLEATVQDGNTQN
ncbi:tetratricopeptide repeat protein [Roseovarius sp.]|uniref:tetratricopeptide repeat protein n=1 Tax=Roseovarius sp. TaxID=1486281 RepID=UPI003D0FDDB5